MRNTYTIFPTTDTQFPFAIISGETPISCHSTHKEALRVQQGYYIGDHAAGT